MALILTRNTTESIKIGDDITIYILGVKGNQVRLGIDCPKTIPVHRSEIYDRLKNNGNGMFINDYKNIIKNRIAGYMIFNPLEKAAETSWLDRCINKSTFGVYYEPTTLPRARALEDIYGMNVDIAKVKITAEIEYL